MDRKVEEGKRISAREVLKKAKRQDEKRGGGEELTDVAKFVKLIDRHEHLCDVEPSVLFLENTRVVEKGSEVSSWDVFL